jgi:CPA2 family monovalent cation:H+ antiporter-2
VLTVLGITFLVAGLSEQIGISAAVGAFLVGLMLSGPAAERAHDLLGPMRDLFAAIFFVFFGLSIDPATIPPIIGVAVLLGVVTFATKVLTGWWSARREGIATRGRFRAGVALVARGEFSIAIAGIGTAGGIEPELASLAGAYVLLMAVVGPVAARFVDPAVRALQSRSATGTTG